MHTKTTSGREINVTPNYSKRTFTIRVEGSKYRTLPMTKIEFNESLHRSNNDWSRFLKTDSYYSVS